VMDVSADDPFNLVRFLLAQRSTHHRPLNEIKDGRKRTHWMWFVFPQVKGLGSSYESSLYGISSLDEATAYVEHPVLGTRLKEIAEACLEIEGKSAKEIFGSPDDLKLRSSMTLFAQISPPNSVFHRVLERYFGGVPDEQTLDLLKLK